MQSLQVRPKSFKDQTKKLYRAMRRKQEADAIALGIPKKKFAHDTKKIKLYEVTEAIYKRGLEHPDTIREMEELRAKGFIS